jgi:glycosyltransferase involved in cell wall biosynthesis
MTTLLYSGNVGYGQDLRTVLQAAVHLNGDTDLHILIVGNGKGLPSVKQFVADLQLKTVEFSEPVPLYKLRELLKTGDIHIICQMPGTEGLLVPSKIYSTLAVGRPSLFFGPHNCEVGQIIRDSRSGFVIEPGDVDSALNALRRLTCSEALRWEMGQNAKEYYDYYFGRQKSVAKIVSIIERVASDGQLASLPIHRIDKGLANEK